MIIAEHILAATEDKIRLQTKAEREAFHAQLHRWIINCNCVVVEASFPSTEYCLEQDTDRDMTVQRAM